MLVRATAATKHHVRRKLVQAKVLDGQTFACTAQRGFLLMRAPAPRYTSNRWYKTGVKASNPAALENRCEKKNTQTDTPLVMTEREVGCEVEVKWHRQVRMLRPPCRTQWICGRVSNVETCDRVCAELVLKIQTGFSIRLFCILKKLQPFSRQQKHTKLTDLVGGQNRPQTQ